MRFGIIYNFRHSLRALQCSLHGQWGTSVLAYAKAYMYINIALFYLFNFCNVMIIESNRSLFPWILPFLPSSTPFSIIIVKAII